MSLSVKCNVAVDFLLVSNSKHMTVSHGLAVIGTWKVSYHLAKISDKRRENWITSSWDWKEGYHQNNVDWLNTFMRMSITINPAEHNQMLQNEYLLVELRRLQYTLLEGFVLNVAHDFISSSLLCLMIYLAPSYVFPNVIAYPPPPYTHTLPTRRPFRYQQPLTLSSSIERLRMVGG